MNILKRYRQMELFAASFRKDETANAAKKGARRSGGREAARRRTVRLAISAIFAALSVTLMFFGVTFGVLDLASLMLASFLVAFCLIEMGSPYQYLVWIVTSVIAFFFVPSKLVFFEYFLFAGVYPILKFRVARLPSAVVWVIKFASFNAALTACTALSTWVLGLDAEEGLVFGWPMYLAGNAMFVLYDLVLSAVSAFYILRLRRAVRADRI